MDQLRRWREPLGIVLAVAAALRLLVGTVTVPVLAGRDAYGDFATAALFEADRSFDVALIVALTVVAASCLLTPATPRARPLVIAAVVITGLSVLVALTYGLMGLTSRSSGRGIESFHLVLGLVLPSLAVIVLVSLLVTTVPAAAPVPEPPAAVAQRESPPEPPTAQPAAWQPDQASGRVWHTAGDAARGAPAGGWAEPGGTGWHPIPGPAEPPGPEQR